VPKEERVGGLIKSRGGLPERKGTSPFLQRAPEINYY